MGRKLLHYLSRAKHLQLFLMLLLLSSFAFAQQSMKITGRVTSSDDQKGLPGVSVKVKGTQTGAVTDASGMYTLNAAKGNVLTFSYVGYDIYEATVGESGTVNVMLKSTSADLQEVVVVSYGSSRQRDITGAVTKVNAEELQNLPAAEIGQKLAGRVPGLQVNQASGRPGQGMTFRVRGAASLGSGNQPLIVVDGQPITGDVNLINPDDIESFSVLKDAASTALYGSRAANGVILITTKTAKAGRSTINFNTYYGAQTVLQRGRPDLMNANEFATFMKGYYEDRIKYENWKNPVTGLAEIPADYANPSQYGEGTDWYNEMLRTAPIQNYNLNISSGTDKVLSSNSLTYFKQDGVLKNTGMQRFSFRSNNQYTPSSKVKFGFNVAPTYQIDNNTRGALDGNRQILVGAEISSPLVPAMNADGSFPTRAGSYGMFALPNYLQQLTLLKNKQNTLRILANAYGEVEILKDLRFRSTINTDLGSADLNSFNSSQYGTAGSPGPSIPSAAHSSNNYTSWLSENILTYKLKVGDHNFDALAGYSAQKYNRNFRTINGSVFPNDNIPWIVGAATTTGSTNNNAWDIASMFARINYDYKGKYFAEFAARRDGSTRFAPDNRYGFFPAGGVSWLLSQEDFLKNAKRIDLLKLRVSYGVVGNNQLENNLLLPSYFPYLGTFATGYDQLESPGIYFDQLANQHIKWERQGNTNIGIDFEGFNSRLTASLDFFNKTSLDLLFNL
ncbi:MAG: SusC/RagA family TonB-linked outer membrane protein, partial [Pedobacter sp.]